MPRFLKCPLPCELVFHWDTLEAFACTDFTHNCASGLICIPEGHSPREIVFKVKKYLARSLVSWRKKMSQLIELKKKEEKNQRSANKAAGGGENDESKIRNLVHER